MMIVTTPMLQVMNPRPRKLGPLAQGCTGGIHIAQVHFLRRILRSFGVPIFSHQHNHLYLEDFPYAAPRSGNVTLATSNHSLA